MGYGRLWVISGMAYHGFNCSSDAADHGYIVDYKIIVQLFVPASQDENCALQQ